MNIKTPKDNKSKKVFGGLLFIYFPKLNNENIVAALITDADPPVKNTYS